jgi:hypothetical protein
MGCCVAGGLEFGAGLVRGHQHASGVRLITFPPIQACCQHAWCLVYVELSTLGREGCMIGGQIVLTDAMAKQVPWHRMCYGPDDPLAEMLAIGND